MSSVMQENCMCNNCMHATGLHIPKIIENLNIHATS